MNYKELNVSEIVTQNIKTSDIFKKYDIDFCCNGNISLETICKNKGLNIEEVISDLKSIKSVTNKDLNFSSMSPSELIDFIQDNHHKYVQSNVGILVQYAEKVARIHGEEHSELLQIKNLVLLLIKDLAPHLEKEESLLFPTIKNMDDAINTNSDNTKQFEVIEPVISAMEYEHNGAGNILSELRTLSNNYTIPEYACNTFTAFYHKLKEFEDDLFQHVHLENNILFPKTAILLKELGIETIQSKKEEIDEELDNLY